MAAPPMTWVGRQFHNQPVRSHQHQFLLGMWRAIERETDGRIAVSVHAQNGGIAGSDPAALDMLLAGDIEFFTVMGGILGRVVPAAEMQGLPFAFARHEQVHAANDGEFGAFIGRECAAKGIHRFRQGLLENGFRHLCMIEQPIRTEDDLADMKIRVPDGQMFRDFFAALGAQPITVNISELYDALKMRRVDGHENPLVITEVNRLFEVTSYVSLTGHMWSGFNLIGNLKFWEMLPADVQAVIERNVATAARAQRAYTNDLNRKLENTLIRRGMRLNQADFSRVRPKLAGVYRRWKEQFGATAWQLLEAEVGTLG